MSNRQYDFWHVWRLPVLLGGLSLIRLLSALIGDRVWDVLSWFSLAIPLAVIGWFVWRARSRKRSSK